MREMRREARELAQTQEEISSKIENETNQKQKTLAASEELKQLGSTFQEQKAGLTNLRATNAASERTSGAFGTDVVAATLRSRAQDQPGQC